MDPASFSSASDIVAVPTDAFKLTRVAAFAHTAIVFRTSGTTQGPQMRGEHAIRDVATYDAAAVAFGRHWLVRDLTPSKIPVLVLAPSPEEVPDSSLIHMCQLFAEAFGHPASRDETFLVRDGIIDLSTFDARVAIAMAQKEPVLLLGTSFAYVHFLDALGDASFALPRGSRVMQTGGYKGKSREVPADALRRELARVLSIDERAIVAEYGMTELSSQFYERSLFDSAAPDRFQVDASSRRPARSGPEQPAAALRTAPQPPTMKSRQIESGIKGVFAEPPWARVVPVDPETLAPVEDGTIGIAKIIDAMNVDSAVAVLTQDRVRRVPGGFELLGRAPGAPPRGCSIAIDELLGRTSNCE